MLTAYINAAMQKAHYEILPDRVRIPNPHKGDIGENLLKQILKEIGHSCSFSRY